MKKQRISVLLGTAMGVAAMVALSACHMVKMHSNDNQYLQVKTAPVLSVPQGASRQSLGNDFPVTGNVYNPQAVSMVPPGSVLASQATEKADKKK